MPLRPQRALFQSAYFQSQSSAVELLLVAHFTTSSISFRVCTDSIRSYKKRTRSKDSDLLKIHYDLRLQVTEQLGRASSPLVRAKLQALLQAAIQGIAVNPTVTTQDLFVFAHGAMDAGLAAEEAARAAAAAAAEAAGQPSANGAPLSLSSL